MPNNACGQLEYTNGGTITSSSILNSQITTSTVSNSTIESSSVVALASIDAASALVIANAIANLSAAQLKALAEALLSALAAVPADAPAVHSGTPLTTEMYGGRSMILGAPVMFAKFDAQHCVPLYKSNQ